jgi:hypothetical protein
MEQSEQGLNTVTFRKDAIPSASAQAVPDSRGMQTWALYPGPRLTHCNSDRGACSAG